MEWLRFLSGFPYEEAPRSYIRKLTLAPKVKAFQLLKKGENIMLTWEISENSADDFSDFCTSCLGIFL